MADSDTVRNRRWRAHKAGDHRGCAIDAPCRADPSGPVARPLSPEGAQDELPECPVSLADEGQALWDSVVSQFVLNGDELIRLASACQVWDRLVVLDRRLETEPWLVPGRYAGQLVISPSCTLDLLWRRELRAMLASLKLPDASDPDVELPASVPDISDRKNRPRTPEAGHGAP